MAFVLSKQAHALAELGLDSLAVNIRIQRPAEADASRPGQTDMPVPCGKTIQASFLYSLFSMR